MHHGVVEHPVVPLLTDTPPRQDHEPIKAFSLLLETLFVPLHLGMTILFVDVNIR
jgi:hypothetical protein